MPLNPTALEYFGGLKRVHARIVKEVNRDDVHHFVVDAWHLIENVENDPTSSRPQRKAAERLRGDETLKICEDLCHEEKHRRKRPGTPTWSIKQGFGRGRYGKGAYGVGEASIKVVCTDGRELPVLNFCAEIVSKFEVVFASTS